MNNNTNQTGNCPYCLSLMEPGEESVRCPKCGVTHHAECWKSNGKCSVYGCDGWVLWNDSITSKIAPETGDSIDVTESGPARAQTEAQPVCIECGRPVKRNQVVCWDCRRRQPKHFFENCSGPAVVMIAGLAGIVTLLIKALT